MSQPYHFARPRERGLRHHFACPRERGLRLSIGVFTYSTKPRGSVVHAACLADALSELGHAVTLYALDKACAGEPGGFFRPLRSRTVCMPAAPAPTDSDALIAQRIAEVAHFVRAHAPRHQVFHAEDCLVASGLLEADAQARMPLLCRTVHHVEPYDSAYLDACQARSIKGADLCLSVSQASAGEVERVYGRKCEVIANGVDAQRFATADRRLISGLRERFGVAPRAPLVLSIGGVEPRKNTLVMLDAFAAFAAQRPDARWLIAGGASIFAHEAYRAAFEQRLAALPSATRAAIVRTGVLEEDEVPALLHGADVLLHTSTREGFGLCVLEAMAAGTPVIVSRGAPFDEYLDEHCALLTDPSDAQAIAHTLARALTSDVETLAAEARRRARSLSWQNCALRHERAYREALARLRPHAAARVPGEE